MIVQKLSYKGRGESKKKENRIKSNGRECFVGKKSLKTVKEERKRDQKFLLIIHIVFHLKAWQNTVLLFQLHFTSSKWYI